MKKSDSDRSAKLPIVLGNFLERNRRLRLGRRRIVLAHITAFPVAMGAMTAAMRSTIIGCARIRALNGSRLRQNHRNAEKERKQTSHRAVR